MKYIVCHAIDTILTIMHTADKNTQSTQRETLVTALATVSSHTQLYAEQWEYMPPTLEQRLVVLCDALDPKRKLGQKICTTCGQIVADPLAEHNYKTCPTPTVDRTRYFAYKPQYNQFCEYCGLTSHKLEQCYHFIRDHKRDKVFEAYNDILDAEDNI